MPESYVKATVTGDVQNRLGMLTQQILSTTRLQKIIETFGLYAEERKALAREDVIAKMRGDINVAMVSGTGAQPALEAFRITYSGKDPRLVAQVTNEIAILFINENLKARELQATGTTDFLQNQLDQTRKTLEAQEGQLRDFRLKHVGEMPEHQVATLTVLGQLQASLQQEGEALNRAEQQRTYLQSMMAQSMPVIDVDTGDEPDNGRPIASASKQQGKTPGTPPSTLSEDRVRLAALLSRYTENHPEVQRLRLQIAEREAKAPRAPQAQPKPTEEAKNAPTEPKVPEPPRKRLFTPPTVNPVLVSQLRTAEAEIDKHKVEVQRLNKLVACVSIQAGGYSGS